MQGSDMASDVPGLAHTTGQSEQQAAIQCFSVIVPGYGRLTFRIEVVKSCMSDAGNFHLPILSHGSPGSMQSLPLTMQM